MPRYNWNSFRNGKSSLIALLTFFILTSNVSNSYCQATALDPELSWSNHRNVADIISYVGPVVSVTFGLIEAKRNGNLKKEVAKDLILAGIAEGTKRLVNRDRPDHSDSKSFFSEHTMFAASLFGQNKSLSVAISFNTAYLRTAANKHYLTDVVTGAVIGSLVSNVMK